ncbi:MAG: hypothetical protein ABS82_01130 [Rhodanobacter sp. SCN 67-45]|nr:MAG: hypothetical protein ABS82_01130 [Rhodanobacter sp. SCN 67-45]
MNDDVSFDHIAAIEHVIENLLPLLIEVSPKRADAIALLRTWAERDTSVREEVALGNLAEEVLKRLPSTG